eukprot:CAMPEP_0204056066 /NCGR_PEP_ID=MMETSP0360-20130528/131618_1 /ASSEMBLY_ACC=CAM_ASM_000342 /TAXON_ID=268821 /ORGANISM="Scrippsiella Hangoei, Strain SHTV-5" /LENGTH=42 /DNA_ID= /DNA_START= /DNA_END= /DNA_ORIENTATION=
MVQHEATRDDLRAVLAMQLLADKSLHEERQGKGLQVVEPQRL